MDPLARQAIERCALFRAMEARWLDLLAAEARMKRYRRDETIFLQGEECPGVFVVRSGLVRVYKIGARGKEHVLHLAEPAMSFGEVAVVGGFPCPASAAAAEAAMCALIPADRFRSLLREHHDFCLQLTRGLALWVRRLVGLLEDLVLRDAVGRVAGRLLRVKGAAPGEVVPLRVMKKDLASHLNLTSETLSRSLRRLVERGVIELPSPHEVRVLDRTALAAIAEGAE